MTIKMDNGMGTGKETGTDIDMAMEMDMDTDTDTDMDTDNGKDWNLDNDIVMDMNIQRSDVGYRMSLKTPRILL
jgi:hypothetical protein